jgi:hypothetical protein
VLSIPQLLNKPNFKFKSGRINRQTKIGPCEHDEILMVASVHGYFLTAAAITSPGKQKQQTP